jgi:hypothetical protein
MLETQTTEKDGTEDLRGRNLLLGDGIRRTIRLSKARKGMLRTIPKSYETIINQCQNLFVFVGCSNFRKVTE